ncbi:MAG: arsenate reductase ArsC [Rhodospirillaceae bacterium]|nr:arsenate reductase ArsC [Rhodospirillales bacterium]
MTDKIFNVLFVCNQNAGRSQMAEVLLNTVGKHRFRAFSAGIEPAAAIDPLTLETIRKGGFSTNGLTVKGLDAFVAADTPHMDFVVTVSEELADFMVPLKGHVMGAHWPIPGPAPLRASQAEKAAAFAEAFKMIRRRVELFVELPMSSLDRLTLQRKVDEIGTS